MADLLLQKLYQYNETTNTVICIICQKIVHVGRGGVDNYETQHKNSPICLAEKARVEREANGLVQTTLSFKKVNRNAVASSSSTQIARSSSSDSVTPSNDGSTPASDATATTQGPLTQPSASTEVNPASHPFVTQFRLLAQSLPSTVPEGTENDKLALLADPAAIDDVNIPGKDLWERLVNDKLKEALDWGGSEDDMDTLLRRGHLGVDGLADFVEHFIRRGVEVCLFEGKLGRLMSAMQNRASPIVHQSLSVAVVGPNKGVEPTPTAPPLEARPPSPEIQIVTYKPAKKASAHTTVCPGYNLPIPKDHSPHTSYPFGLHGKMYIPWNYSVVGTEMFLKSHQCQGKVTEPGSPCSSCAEIARSPVARGILDRMNNGTHINTAYAYLGHHELTLALKEKNDQIQHLRFLALNQTRAILHKSESLSDYKRLVVAISREDIPRIARVVDIALKQKRSITAILETVMDAAKGVYKVKSFGDRDRQLATLLWRLGGDRVGHIVHRALGLPAVNTLRGGAARAPLLPSSGRPKVVEIAKNTLNVLEGVMDILKSGDAWADLVHAVAMVDEIAVEKRPRFNPRTNTFEGVCRQHGEKVSLQFNSASDMVELFKAIDDGEVHLAGEGTVGAIGLLCKESRVYSSRTVLISADCKKESAEEHAANLLQPLLDGVNHVKDKTKIRIVSLASDGESRRGAAMVLLTFKRLLSESSPIYRHLAPLSLMNRHVGDDDITCDKDWKHIFKRFRNLLLRERGVVVDHFRITPAIIKQHLRDAGKSKEHVNSVTNPEDLQDVKLAFDLLHDIWSLPTLEPNSSANPGYRKAREALRLLGRLLHHLVYPYLCIDLSLSEQLEHLSAASHLLFVLYKSAGKDFIPTQLYIDIALMIKNVFFCVAKAKVDTPNGCFFIILLGTDRLEIHFGILRTVVGNDCNLDILQISERSAGLIDIADILAQRPEWDQGPRRMQLPTLLKGCDEVPKSSDHLSPKYLRGDYEVRGVTLWTCWRVGRSIAEADYAPAAAILQQAEQDEAVDMLSPSGKLLVDAPLSPDDVDESSEAFLMNTESTVAEPVDGLEGETQVDLENEMQEAETAAAVSTVSENPQPRTSISHTVIVDGKAVSKAKLLAQYSRYRNKASSADRLKRVQEVERYASAQTVQGTSYDIDTNLLLIHDPIATLVYSEGRLWLALGEVNGLRYDSQSIDRIGHNLLSEPAVKVSFQLLGLRLVVEGDNAPLQYEWRTYTTPGSCFEIAGVGVEPLDPEVSKGSERPFYLFASSFLVATTALLMQRIPKASLKALPKMAATTDYPYRDANGKLPEIAPRIVKTDRMPSDKCCFLAEVSNTDLETVANASTSRCTLCEPAVALDLSDGQRVLEHIGCHILFDPAVKRTDLPCGLCLLPPSLCKYFVVRGKGSKASMRVDHLRSSGCSRSVNYQYARAATSVKSAPCSNVPLRCPLCPKSEPAVWRYNLEQHLKFAHSPDAATRYAELWEIDETERTAMKFIWSNRKKQKARKSKKKKEQGLTISKEHASSAFNTNRNPGAEGVSSPEDDVHEAERDDGIADKEAESWQDDEIPEKDGEFGSEGDEFGGEDDVSDFPGNGNDPTWEPELQLERGLAEGQEQGAPACDKLADKGLGDSDTQTPTAVQTPLIIERHALPNTVDSRHTPQPLPSSRAGWGRRELLRQTPTLFNRHRWARLAARPPIVLPPSFAESASPLLKRSGYSVLSLHHLPPVDGPRQSGRIRPNSEEPKAPPDADTSLRRPLWMTCIMAERPKNASQGHCVDRRRFLGGEVAWRGGCSVDGDEPRREGERRGRLLWVRVNEVGLASPVSFIPFELPSYFVTEADICDLLHSLGPLSALLLVLAAAISRHPFTHPSTLSRASVHRFPLPQYARIYLPNRLEDLTPSVFL
ncbi:hypothetical protein NMY22_g1393 [Coprinellus aureogranulatus]|nr:hypothetical protein NMY22_g1393 [Coprinellus aureogranulatus]